MNGTKLNHRDNVKFIKLLRAHRCLWDNTCEDSRSITMRKVALDKIASIMGISNAAVRKKIHNMRSQYRRERIRIQTLGKDQHKWLYFDALKFLNNSFISRKPTGYDSESEVILKDETFFEDSNMNSEELSDDYDVNDDNTLASFEECQFEVVDSSPQVESESQMIQNESPYKTRRFSKLKNAAVIPKIDLKDNISLIPVATPKKQDEFTIFGEHVANELRLLKNNKRLQQALKCSILQAILDINRAAYDCKLLEQENNANFSDKFQ